MSRTNAVLLAITLVFLIGAAIRVAENGRSSDIVREWAVSRYVNAGQDPWELAKGILFAKYGEGNPRQVRMFEFPREIPADFADEIIPDLPPQEPTYPPPAIGMLAATIGQVPSHEAVLWIWFVVNVAAMGWVAAELTRFWPVPPGGGTRSENRQLVLLALLLLPATFHTFRSGQFSLLVLGLLLMASSPSRGWLVRGLALGAALIKPSLALPFFFLPVVNRQWRVVLTAAAVQAAGAGYVALQTGGNVIGMFRDWIALSEFFLNGINTLPEWLRLLVPIFPRLEPTVASFGVLAFGGMTLFLAWNMEPTRQFIIAAVTSIFWTTHHYYDFVVVLPVLMLHAGWSRQLPAKRWSALGLTMFAILATALLTLVYDNPYDFLIFQIIQWMARFVLLGLFAWKYLRVDGRIFGRGGMKREGSVPREQPATTRPVATSSS